MRALHSPVSMADGRANHQASPSGQYEKLSSKQFFGLDFIPNYVMKGCSESLLKPLCYIINLCSCKATFPKLLKTTKITPISKKGIESDISNYKPVSVLCTPSSKVFEIIVHSPYMKSYFSEKQHSFIPSQQIL